MAWRDVAGRYRGSMLGLLWSFFNPLFMLAVYTFVFGVVFKFRAAGTGGGMAEFATFIFAGLTIFNLFAETLNRSPTLILQNVSYVKKVVFPLEILPVVTLLSALFHAVVSLLVLMVFHAVISGGVPYTVVFLPLVLVPLILLTLGLSWFLASLGVYLRDVAQSIGILTSALLFLSAVFYPLSALPESVRVYEFLNPLAFIIEQTRAVLLRGELPDAWGMLAYTVASVLVAAGGLYWFQRTRRGFADVL